MKKKRKIVKALREKFNEEKNPNVREKTRQIFSLLFLNAKLLTLNGK